MNVHRHGTERQPWEYAQGQEKAPQLREQSGAVGHAEPLGRHLVTETNDTAPPPARARVALIRSIANHADDDTRALDEIRAVLAGATISDLLLMRGVS